MRIFIACPDEKLRLALILSLEEEPGMAVIGISDRLTGLLTQLEGSEPDVLMLSWVSPVQLIACLLTDLHTLKHRPKTIVFSTRTEDKERIIEAGADYFVPMDAPPDTLMPILNEIRLSISHAVNS